MKCLLNLSLLFLSIVLGIEAAQATVQVYDNVKDTSHSKQWRTSDNDDSKKFNGRGAKMNTHMDADVAYAPPTKEMTGEPPKKHFNGDTKMDTKVKREDKYAPPKANEVEGKPSKKHLMGDRKLDTFQVNNNRYAPPKAAEVVGKQPKKEIKKGKKQSKNVKGEQNMQHNAIPEVSEPRNDGSHMKGSRKIGSHFGSTFYAPPSSEKVANTKMLRNNGEGRKQDKRNSKPVSAEDLGHGIERAKKVIHEEVSGKKPVSAFDLPRGDVKALPIREATKSSDGKQREKAGELLVLVVQVESRQSGSGGGRRRRRR